MPCGCRGKSATLPNSMTASSTGSSSPTTSRVAVYEVVKDGNVILTTTSPSAARQEARRLNASIRVSSRPVESSEPSALEEVTV